MLWVPSVSSVVAVLWHRLRPRWMNMCSCFTYIRDRCQLPGMVLSTADRELERQPCPWSSHSSRNVQGCQAAKMGQCLSLFRLLEQNTIAWGLKNRHVSLPVLEAGSPRSRHQQSAAAETLLPGLQTATFLLSPHLAESGDPGFSLPRLIKTLIPSWGNGLNIGIVRGRRYSVCDRHVQGRASERLRRGSLYCPRTQGALP